MENHYNYFIEESEQSTVRINTKKFLPFEREEPVPNLIGYGFNKVKDGRDLS